MHFPQTIQLRRARCPRGFALRFYTEEGNLAGPLCQVDDSIRNRQLGHFDKADSAYGAGVRAALEARVRESD